MRNEYNVLSEASIGANDWNMFVQRKKKLFYRLELQGNGPVSDLML